MSKQIKKGQLTLTASKAARYRKLLSVVPYPINHWECMPDLADGGVRWEPRVDAAHITAAAYVLEAIDEFERIAKWCFVDQGADRGSISYDRLDELKEAAIRFLRERVAAEQRDTGPVAGLAIGESIEFELRECSDGASPWEHTMAQATMGTCPWCGEQA